VNPLVDWIWFGFGVLALGTGIALLPERAYAFAVAKLPIEVAASTVALLLMVVLCGGSTVFAQHGSGVPIGSADDVRTSFYPRTDLERRLQHEIVCTCGACGHASIAECRKDACGESHRLRGELAAFIDQGKSHDEIIQAFVTRYGNEEMLGAPIDKGFNRLAWFFPYLIGVSSAAAIGFAAVRWSRHPDLRASEAPSSTDLKIEERLDDELRNLD
jgi:cytochrome c-type biogenesis protein CcmH/NrfF